MQLSLEELKEIVGKSAPVTHNSPPKDLGCQIIVADRGFVYVGQTVVDGDYVRVTNARNIRVWGTSQGLGELVSGPTKDTKLDQVGEILLPVKAVIHFIKCTRDW